MSVTSQEFSLYIHVPFCRRKCDYCHFYVIPDQERFKIEYMKALQKEWEIKSSLFENKKLVSIYFGGGTPALLGPERISTILKWISPDLQTTEITLEANPENISVSLMTAYKQAGINRVSIGVQTFDNSLLKMLGREHGSDKAEQAVYHTYEAGITNLTIDLMFDQPSQTLKSWEDTLQRALSLPITHLSLYNLTFEPHTSFYKKKEKLKGLLPSEETSLKMLEIAIEHCENKKLSRYEISAFSKPGYNSQHNYGYWTGRPFQGLGPAAYSYWNQSRFRNIAHLNRYCKKLSENLSPVDFSETLPADGQLRELLAVRLRLLEGIPYAEFISLPYTIQELLHTFIKEGLAFLSSTSYALTNKGLLLHDWIAEELIEI